MASYQDGVVEELSVLGRQYLGSFVSSRLLVSRGGSVEG